jgi:hypothetical protein
MTRKVLISKILFFTMLITLCLYFVGVNSIRADTSATTATPEPTSTPVAAPTPIPNPRQIVMTLTVGPGKMYKNVKDALSQAIKGDTIEVDARGVYFGADAMCAVTVDNITIVGVNGRPKMQAEPKLKLTWGKALWVLNAANTTVRNIELSDAACEDLNGAGIRIDEAAVGAITIKDCYFNSCQNGILGGTPAVTALDIENCEFNYCGAGDGLSHSVYIGNVDSLIFEYNYSHHVAAGHHLKTRANNNIIQYNRLADEDTSSRWNSSSNIDIPDGGNAYIVGNILQQGTYKSNNGRMISYGLESTKNSEKEVYIANNTFINERTDLGLFISALNDPTYTIAYVNNIFSGVGTITGGSAKFVQSNNYISKKSDPGFFVDYKKYNYHLKENATKVIDKGIDADKSDIVTEVPISEYVDQCSSIDRNVDGKAIDIGAYEFIKPVVTTKPVKK